MLHFTKDDETFRRFCAELLSANPKLTDIKTVGVDMESAISNGFKSLIKSLSKLYCARHLSKRDEVAIDKNRTRCQAEIIKDLYGDRDMEVYEFGLDESFDEDDFNEKLTGLKPRWEKLCPGFHKWFITHRKKDFIESVIRTAREGTSVDGLFYQNDIESLHAAQKRIQCFKSQDVLWSRSNDGKTDTTRRKRRSNGDIWQWKLRAFSRLC